MPQVPINNATTERPAAKMLIGIDCGTHTGLAVYDPAAKALTTLETMPIHRAMEAVLAMSNTPGASVEVYFEDARLRTWFEKERNASDYRGKLMGAGAVKRDSAIWEDFLTDKKIPFKAVAPKHNATKMSRTMFEKVTGWHARCSEHARDAAMLVFQR